jgi:FMN reductase
VFEFPPEFAARARPNGRPTTDNVVAFVGSRRPTKAHLLVAAVSAACRDRHQIGVRTVDLANAGCGLCALERDELDPQSKALIGELEGCDGLIVGCPVFQGSYPGLFKHVFDLVRPSALRNKPVLLTAVGGGLRHSLVVEHQLRPLFGFFEASTISTAIYACADELASGEAQSSVLKTRIANAVDQFANHFGNASRTNTH